MLGIYAKTFFTAARSNAPAPKAAPPAPRPAHTKGTPA
ncbi:hypothetical protein SAMN04490248_12537 [Salinihabitans flavidus]|uniref:Uncharacterized protein n=1 Tax=Salinihabitans flavidus TaxID=569882 RepID=A0A1H8V5U2_9RHOB|nr:hypothetical protein SAMN04490248_12537 [Salinihabitans flavidus]